MPTKPKVDTTVSLQSGNEFTTVDTSQMEHTTMANDNTPQANNEFTTDTEEFTAEDIPIVPGTSHSAPQIVEGTLSLDQLNELTFDDSRDEAERAKINPPTGDWEKEDRWKFDKRVNAADSVHGDIDPTGRTFFNVFGKAKTRVVGDISHDPTLFLRISPDIRYKQDKPNEVDMAYKLFLKAKDVYTELYEQKPTKLGQLITMLEEDNYVVRTMNGDNGPVIVDVKVKRNRR